jgi:hypothetical protein
MARQLELADSDLTRAFSAIDPATRQDLPAALVEMLSLLAQPESVDSSPNVRRFIRAMQASTQIDYGAMFDAAGRVSGVLHVTNTSAPTTAPASQPAATQPAVSPAPGERPVR